MINSLLQYITYKQQTTNKKKSFRIWNYKLFQFFSSLISRARKKKNKGILFVYRISFHFVSSIHSFIRYSIQFNTVSKHSSWFSTWLILFFSVCIVRRIKRNCKEEKKRKNFHCKKKMRIRCCNFFGWRKTKKISKNKVFFFWLKNRWLNYKKKRKEIKSLV